MCRFWTAYKTIKKIRLNNLKHIDMKTVNSILVISVLTLFLTCKNDKKSNDEIEVKSDRNTKAEDNYFDGELEEALYNGNFIKNEDGYDTVIFNNTLYLLRANASENQKSKHFFMHVIPSNGNLINLDFPASDHLINGQLSDKFVNVRVYKLELPKVEGSYNINVGQFEGNIRLWNSHIIVDLLNKVDHSYKNEYVEYATNNRYLNDFKKAFDQGYFMKHQEGYDLLLDDHTLYYILTDRDKANLNNMFFLHVKFDDKDEVLNLDFKGKPYEIDQLLGKEFEFFVVIKKEIPNNGKITEVETGQFINDNRLWSYVYEPEKLYDDMTFIYNDQYEEVLK